MLVLRSKQLHQKCIGVLLQESSKLFQRPSLQFVAMLVLYPGLQESCTLSQLHSVPAVLGRRRGYTLYKSAAHHRERPSIMDSLQLPIRLMSVSLPVEHPSRRWKNIETPHRKILGGNQTFGRLAARQQCQLQTRQTSRTTFF